MAGMIEIEKNSQGTVSTTPVTEWAVGPLADTVVVAAFAYLQETSKGIVEGKRVQLTLMPQQALELAETLTRAAQRVLYPDSSQGAQ